jgi:hypothetical protein
MQHGGLGGASDGRSDSENWQFQHAISTLASRVSLKHDVLIGPRVIGQERWERMKQHRFGLFQFLNYPTTCQVMCFTAVRSLQIRRKSLSNSPNQAVLHRGEIAVNFRLG